MIKVQVKSLIELSFRLISFLPLEAESSQTSSLHRERQRVTSETAECFILDDGTSQI